MHWLQSCCQVPAAVAVWSWPEPGPGEGEGTTKQGLRKRKEKEKEKKILFLRDPGPTHGPRVSTIKGSP